MIWPFKCTDDLDKPQVLLLVPVQDTHAYGLLLSHKQLEFWGLGCCLFAVCFFIIMSFTRSKARQRSFVYCRWMSVQACRGYCKFTYIVMFPGQLYLPPLPSSRHGLWVQTEPGHDFIFPSSLTSSCPVVKRRETDQQTNNHLYHLYCLLLVVTWGRRSTQGTPRHFALPLLDSTLENLWTLP